MVETFVEGERSPQQQFEGTLTYTVNGLRQLTVGEHVDSRLWIAIAVLVGILLVSLTASALSVRRNRRYTMERLYPPIEA